MPALQILLTPHLFSPIASSPAFPFNYGPCHVQSLPFQFATRLTCLYLPSRALTIPDTPHLACRAPTLRVILSELSPDFPCLPDLNSPVPIVPFAACVTLPCRIVPRLNALAAPAFPCLLFPYPPYPTPPLRSMPALPSHSCPNRNSTHPVAPLLPCLHNPHRAATLHTP